MTKTFYFIAGEASGDNFGAKLIKKLAIIADKKIDLAGIGGDKMIEQGLKPLFPMQEISLIGFLEVLPKIFKLEKRINQTVADIIFRQPDVLITIDSPGFNFRVANKLRINGYKGKIVHFVAPSVWAYKPGRAKKFAKIFDHLLCILPFEPEYFTKHGLDATFIGNPIIEDIYQDEQLDFRKAYNIKPNDFIICMMPGSRNGEIKRLLPIFLDAIKQIDKKITVVIPTLANLKPIIETYIEQLGGKQIIICDDPKFKSSIMQQASIGLIKSGTSSVEAALFGLPHIVAYKVNLFSSLIIKLLIKIKYASLVNIICNKAVVPEFLQKNCTSMKISQRLQKLINDKALQKKQKTAFKEVIEVMGGTLKDAPSLSGAKIVWNLSKKK